jgi:hypothetical protein
VILSREQHLEGWHQLAVKRERREGGVVEPVAKETVVACVTAPGDLQPGVVAPQRGQQPGLGGTRCFPMALPRKHASPATQIASARAGRARG